MVNLAIALGFMFVSAWVGERIKAWLAGRAEQAHRLSEGRRL
jgi:hypothetical protein